MPDKTLTVELETVEVKDLGTAGSFRRILMRLKDSEGNSYVARFRIRTIYDDQMRKAFRRLIPVKTAFDVHNSPEAKDA